MIGSRAGGKAEPPSDGLPPSELRQTIERGRIVDRQGVDCRPADLSCGYQRVLSRGEFAFQQLGGGRALFGVALCPHHRFT